MRCRNFSPFPFSSPPFFPPPQNNHNTTMPRTEAKADPAKQLMIKTKACQRYDRPLLSCSQQVTLCVSQHCKFETLAISVVQYSQYKLTLSLLFASPKHSLHYKKAHQRIQILRTRSHPKRTQAPTNEG